MRFLISSLLLSLCLAPVHASVLDLDPYAPDPDFNNGVTRVDPFHNPRSHDRKGAGVVRLADGDLVVAATVRVPGHTGDGSSLGLVRYAPDGSHRDWSDPEPELSVGGPYLVFPATPGAGDASAHERWVDDVKRLGSRIFVLFGVRRPESHTNIRGVAVFSDQGRLLSVYTTTIENLAPGASMLVHNYNTFPGGEVVKVYTATALLNLNTNRVNMVVSRLHFNQDDELVHDSSFNSPFSFRHYNLADSCSTYATAVHQFGVSIAGSNLTGSSPRLYIAGTIERNGKTDVVVLAINGGTSEPVSEFGNACSSGFRFINFDDGGGLNDRAVDIISTNPLGFGDPVIHVLAQVDRDCAPGIGVVRLGATGFPTPSFGSGGRLVFGGATSSGGGLCLPAFARSTDIPLAFVRSGSRLAIVGHSDTADFTGASFRDPFLAVVGADNAQVTEFVDVPVRKTVGGERIGDGSYRDVIVDGGSRFTVTGEALDGLLLTPRMRVVTGRMVPDRIYGNGFQ